ncbi:type IX secretion system membrane protein PorP/SprF [uncultured Cytophaga sp.]|uniref:PorP/SprF family type IX secretion system membrane protein n=1 Tax=uncultured Cytophaga sp. TaxID=160238 RepID=UPI00260533A6|nr:type IX secretion system membrane protein PorP/SprF [uncultured Cytophaga sp.]
MKFIFKFSLILFVFNSLLLKGQDVQFSQYYNSTIFSNPAFAGTGNNTRVGTIYRTQWTNIAKPYNTFAVWGDHAIESARLGVGLWIMRDAQGQARTNSTEVNASVSYLIPFEGGWSFRAGLQLGMINRNANYTNALFGDQIDNNGTTGATSTDPILGYSPSKTFADIGAGGLLYNRNFWIGLGFNHINTPNQSVTNVQGFDLPMRINVQTGYKISLNGTGGYKNYRPKGSKEISLTPTLNFKNQGSNNQLDIGLYYTYQPIRFGIWYRGIPVLPNNGKPNNEAIIPMVSFIQKGFTFTYSYDYTISSLTTKQSGGSHELSLIYEFRVPYKKSKANHRTIPCPNFERSYEHY